jgi:hypothetical protein
MNYIDCNVHLIETSKDNPIKVQITKMPQKDELVAHCAGGEFKKYLSIRYKPQHLYFTNHSEIKKDDWVIDKSELRRATENFPSTSWCQKICATTNSDLWESKTTSEEYLNMGQYTKTFNTVKGIPKIPQSFILDYIEKYNASTPITKVKLEQIDNGYEVDMEGRGGSNVDWMLQLELKLNNGSVIVIKEEKKLYTRTEVKKILKRFDIEGGVGDNCGPTTRNKWFDKNYPE